MVRAGMNHGQVRANYRPLMPNFMVRILLVGQPISDKTKDRMKKKVPANVLKIFGGAELLLQIKL